MKLRSADVPLTQEEITQTLKTFGDEIEKQKVAYALFPLMAMGSNHRARFFRFLALEIGKAREASIRHNTVLRRHFAADSSERLIEIALDALVDECAFWQRKVVEILIDTILFTTTPEDEHFHLYYLKQSLKSHKDIKEDFEVLFEMPCVAGNAAIERDKETYTALKERTGNVKRWYEEKTKERRKLARINAVLQDKFVIGTGSDFAIRSQIIHGNQFRTLQQDISETDAVLIHGLTVYTTNRLILASSRLYGTKYEKAFAPLEEFSPHIFVTQEMMDSIQPNFAQGERVKISPEYGGGCAVGVVKEMGFTREGAQKFLVEGLASDGAEVTEWYPAHALFRSQ